MSTLEQIAPFLASADDWLPLAILLTSAFASIAIFFLREESFWLRTTLNLGAALFKIALVLVMTVGVMRGEVYETRLVFAPGIELVLFADALSVLFGALSSILWLLTTIYAIGYLEGSPNRSRFFGFFGLCVSATMGIALAGNLLTFLVFYEILTLATYPLVVHRGSDMAIRAGRAYLAYTLSGGVLLLIGTAGLYALAGDVDFTVGGTLEPYVAEHRSLLILLFVILIAGLGVKAALVPLHGWLPLSMVAPAPVSALLHAVAVVKAGAFGIVRVIYDVYGIDVVQKLGLNIPLAALAAGTIVFGSLCALRQDDLKRRLAFSTVSQVSYIILGAALAHPLATIGGIIHLIHQGLMKITLFFCAGNYAEAFGVDRVSRMNGIGLRMPWTTAAFTIGALGMIGAPPTAGFITKWYLGGGALMAGEFWVIAILATSSLLNAAYFLPILNAAWFRPADSDWPRDRTEGRRDAPWILVLPPLATSTLVLGAALLATAPFSPLGWTEALVVTEFGFERDTE